MVKVYYNLNDTRWGDQLYKEVNRDIDLIGNREVPYDIHACVLTPLRKNCFHVFNMTRVLFRNPAVPVIFAFSIEDWDDFQPFKLSLNETCQLEELGAEVLKNGGIYLVEHEVKALTSRLGKCILNYRQEDA